MKLLDPKLPTSLGSSRRGPRFLSIKVLRVAGRFALLALVLSSSLAAIPLAGTNWPDFAPLAAGQGVAVQERPGLARPERVADGILLYRWNDPSLLSPPGVVAVQMLQLDPTLVDLEVALAEDRLPAKETVVSMAKRKSAVAAVNSGFFVVATGAPAGLLKLDGKVIGTSANPRGAVGIRPASGREPLRLVFDQVSAQRQAPGRSGEPSLKPRLGSSARDWSRARDIVGGAALLRRNGRSLRPADWVPEKMQAGFINDRHPRTLIGTDAEGAIWLVTVDGRNPSISLGMTLHELQALAERLGLRNALNLDGGGSTTMVVKGEVVNHPSDPTGPRKVSDALLVFTRASR